LYEGITPENEELIVAEIKHCILKYEPRVTVVEV
jgi:predicted component of type VI protein secretion system